MNNRTVCPLFHKETGYEFKEHKNGFEEVIYACGCRPPYLFIERVGTDSCPKCGKEVGIAVFCLKSGYLDQEFCKVYRCEECGLPHKEEKISSPRVFSMY